MIRRWLERLADWLIDDNWLRERRKQELAATRSAQFISRHEPPFEGDFFPQAPQRTPEGHKP